MKGGLLLDIVVRESAAVLQLLPRENQPLLVRRDPLLVLLRLEEYLLVYHTENVINLNQSELTERKELINLSQHMRHPDKSRKVQKVRHNT